MAEAFDFAGFKFGQQFGFFDKNICGRRIFGFEDGVVYIYFGNPVYFIRSLFIGRQGGKFPGKLDLAADLPDLEIFNRRWGILRFQNQGSFLAATGKSQDQQKDGKYFFYHCLLQDVFAQIAILDDILDFFYDILAVDFHLAVFQVGSLVGNVLHDFFHDGVQAAGADIFR